MTKNNKIEDSLNTLFSTSGYKMVNVSDKAITHRKALAVGADRGIHVKVDNYI